MQFIDEYNKKKDYVNRWLEDVMPDAKGEQKEIYEAMRYSLFAGGKRIRPVLAMAVCEMLGRDVENVMPFACAIEMIHTYSLIHDDLPAMDNDDFRRGIPTCHKKFGEATAILAGDALQSYAFEVMTKATVKPQIALEAIGTVALAIGAEGMVGGQIMDIKGCKGDIKLQRKMNMLKTGALIMCSACVGAIIGEADIEQYKAIGNYAKNIGLAFQIKDDILDIEGNASIMGKSTGNDEKQDKCTYVNLLGIDGAKKLLSKLTASAKEEIGYFKEQSNFLKELADYLYNREK